MDGIRHLGTIFDRPEEANTLVLNMQQKLNDVKKKASLLPKKLKVYIEEWPPSALPGRASPFAKASGDKTAGKPTNDKVSGNWVQELIKMSVGESFPMAKDSLSREISLLELTGFDADMMVISWCGAGELVDISTIEKREQWKELRFVREQKIRVIDDSLLNRPGPRIVEGAQHLYGWLFEALH